MVNVEIAPEQLQQLAQGPALAAMLIMRSDRSNPISATIEATASAHAFHDGLTDASTTVMQALKQEYGQLGVDGLREMMALNLAGADFDSLHAHVLTNLHTRVELARTIGGHEDSRAYARFVLHVARAVAGAAPEGRFLGIGGKSISAIEQTILDELSAALEV